MNIKFYNHLLQTSEEKENVEEKCNVKRKQSKEYILTIHIEM